MLEHTLAHCGEGGVIFIFIVGKLLAAEGWAGQTEEPFAAPAQLSAVRGYAAVQSGRQHRSHRAEENRAFKKDENRLFFPCQSFKAGHSRGL